MKINGVKHYLWRAVDHEGEVLESFVTKRRDKKAALKFLRKSLRRHATTETIVTDRLASYGAALKQLGAIDKRETGRWGTVVNLVLGAILPPMEGAYGNQERHTGSTAGRA